MVCTFIKACENKKELYLALIIELQNNNINYSELLSGDGVFRVKAECSQSDISGFEISQSFEFKEYGELKCSKKSGLEGVLGSFNFEIEDKFLRIHFEKILDKNKIPVVRNIDTNSYRIKNRNFYLVEHDWKLKYNTLKSFHLVKDEFALIVNGNNLKVQKLI
jgi:hypothetical protein